MTSLHTNRKRKRDDGASMDRLRQTVDPDTGEVYHVETTRQAKIRHRISGGAQFRPTVAQINAADIWNKQEEKIKKDKEREERRKKNKIKQDAKDARQREIQQEMLKKGKISLEDTWGKVNASQNRIHRFFAAPRVQDKLIRKSAKQRSVSPDSDSSESDTEQDRSKNTGVHKLSQREQVQTVNHQNATSMLPTLPTLSTIMDHTNGSPTHHKHKLVDHPSTGETNPPQGRGRAPMKRCLSASQALMPPPALPTVLSSVSRDIQDAVSSIRNQAPRSGESRTESSAQRPPLGEMTMSEVNVRANEKPDPLIAEAEAEQNDICFPVATQIVRDTLSGLCSQDFDDDFVDGLAEDEKENHSPFSSFKSTNSRCDEETPVSPGVPSREKDVNSDGANVDHESAFDQAFEPDYFDDYFDDGGINDEFLLSLAATQQLKPEFLQPLKQKPWSQSHSQKRTAKATPNLAPVRSPCQSRQILSKTSAPTFPAQTGDSFAMDDLNDNDLIEGLEDYENDTEGLDDEDFLRCIEGLEQTKHHHHHEVENGGVDVPVKKKRRVLPWDRNPIPGMKLNTATASNNGDRYAGMSDELTPSPTSLLHDD